MSTRKCLTHVCQLPVHYSVQLCIRFRPFCIFNKSYQIKTKQLSSAVQLNTSTQLTGAVQNNKASRLTRAMLHQPYKSADAHLRNIANTGRTVTDCLDRHGNKDLVRTTHVSLRRQREKQIKLNSVIDKRQE